MQKNKRTFSASTALLLIAAMLFLATSGAAFNLQHQASAAKPPKPAHPYYPQDVYDRFKQFSGLLWHYDYKKSESKNVQDFLKWYCPPNSVGGTPSQCTGIKDSAAAIDLMRYVAVYGDGYAYNLAVTRKENKPAHDDIIRVYIGSNLDNNALVFAKIEPTAWHIFVQYEKQAFHYDYNRAAQANLKQFEKYNSWMKLDSTLQERWMWYNEQVRDGTLYDVALSYAHGQQAPIYFLPNTPTAPESITSHIVNSWISWEGKLRDWLFKV